MLPDQPHDNNGCCFIMYQLAQSRPPRSYTGILNSNLPNRKSTVIHHPKLKILLHASVLNHKHKNGLDEHC